MSFRLSACLPIVLALALHAGIVRSATPNDAAGASAGRPDACKLMTQADVSALYPGLPVKNFSKELSPVFRGPQFVSICGYNVKLPSGGLPKYASLVVSSCGVCDKSSPAPASLGNAPQGEAAIPGTEVKLLSHVGDEAFEAFYTTRGEYKLYVRKDDLIFILTLDKSSAKSESDAVALAKQAVKRWRGGVGMVDAATPIDTKTVVEAVAYTPPPPKAPVPLPASLSTPPAGMAMRPSKSAPQDKWPDPCKLLPLSDIRTVFGDMTIDPPQKPVPMKMPDGIPAPLSCDYSAHKNVTVDGKRAFVFNSVRFTIFDMATSVDFAKGYYRIGHGNMPLAGLGDDASIDDTNHIYIRKGVLNVVVYVGGDVRDRARFEDSRKRLNAIAKLVAAHLP